MVYGDGEPDYGPVLAIRRDALRDVWSVKPYSAVIDDIAKALQGVDQTLTGEVRVVLVQEKVLRRRKASDLEAHALDGRWCNRSVPVN